MDGGRKQKEDGFTLIKDHHTTTKGEASMPKIVRADINTLLAVALNRTRMKNAIKKDRGK